MRSLFFSWSSRHHCPMEVGAYAEMSTYCIITPPPIGSAEYCDERVCVCVFVCSRSYLWDSFYKNVALKNCLKLRSFMRL